MAIAAAASRNRFTYARLLARKPHSLPDPVEHVSTGRLFGIGTRYPPDSGPDSES